MDKTNQDNEDEIILFERCTNLDDIILFKNLITCPICFNILIVPKKCSICSNVFCEKCIKNWEHKKKECPFKCKNFKLSDTDLTFNRFLYLLKIKCKYEKCDYISDYDNVLSHEKNCDLKEMVCLNLGCNKNLNFKDMLNHITTECEFTEIKCPCCNLIVRKNIFTEHFNKCNNYYKYCCSCKSILNFNKSVCICLKKYCSTCFENPKNIECAKTCFLWDNKNSKSNNFFNISLRQMPSKFSAKIRVNNFTVLRVGVTLDHNITDDNNKPGLGNMDSISRDVYFISLNGLRYYTKDYDWFDIENVGEIKDGFKINDVITIEVNHQYITFYKNDVKIKPILEIKNYDVNSSHAYLICHSKAQTLEVAKSRNQVEIISIKCI